MLRNLFNGSTIFVLCVFTLLLFSGKTYSDTKVPNEKGQIKESGKLPEWVIKGFWKTNGNFYASGSYSGQFVNERDAYFTALIELSINIEEQLSESRIDHPAFEESVIKSTTKMELANSINCKSITKQYQIIQKDTPSELSTENEKIKASSEEYSSKYEESGDGVSTRFYISVTDNNYPMEYNLEMAFECSTKDLSETLKRIPIVDTYIHRKNGRVETFVLIKYPIKYLKDLKNEKPSQKSLKEDGD